VNRVPAPNKQLQRTVKRRRGESAAFHYALASRITRQRAAAQLQRYAARHVGVRFGSPSAPVR
jgi:hypothetical protein